MLMIQEYKQLSELIQMGMYGGDDFPKELFERFWNYPIRVVKCRDKGAYQVSNDYSYIEHEELRHHLSNN